MSELKVTQVRSVIDRPRDQKDTVRRLGLHRVNDTVVKEDRPEIRGMIAKVRHLVRVEEVPGRAQRGAGKEETSAKRGAGKEQP
jgi:large subunit ribosomal protein L30